MSTATARARANIALVKYWGKADPASNLPATGSISMTLSSLHTTTRVSFLEPLRRDEVFLNRREASGQVQARVSRFLARVRTLAGREVFARVETTNSFPTAAGLASSASGFAALAASASRAAGLELPPADLAELARLGSGSAPRSLYGGFVEIFRGDLTLDALQPPQQIAATDHWKVRLVIAVCSDTSKKIGSGEGMERSRKTSCFYPPWIDNHDEDIQVARDAIRRKDFTALGRVAESSCFKMHAVAISSTPAILYWNPVTVAAIHKVWNLREGGLEGYVTIDAGPQVKVFCREDKAHAFADGLSKIPGVSRVYIEQPGSGVEFLA